VQTIGTKTLMAGAFVGVGSLMLIGGGIYCVAKGDVQTGMSLIAAGSPMVSTLMAFFVGENNQKKKQESP